jgi:hypothetical protein
MSLFIAKLTTMLAVSTSSTVFQDLLAGLTKLSRYKKIFTSSQDTQGTIFSKTVLAAPHSRAPSFQDQSVSPYHHSSNVSTVTALSKDRSQKVIL